MFLNKFTRVIFGVFFSLNQRKNGHSPNINQILIYFDGSENNEIYI